MKVYTVGQYARTREDTLSLELYGIFDSEDKAEAFAEKRRIENGEDTLDISDIVVEEVEVQ